MRRCLAIASLHLLAVLALAGALRPARAAGAGPDSGAQQGSIRRVVPRSPSSSDSLRQAAEPVPARASPTGPGADGTSGSFSSGNREVSFTGGRAAFFGGERSTEEIGWGASFRMLWLFGNGVGLGWQSGYHRIDHDVRVIPATFEVTLPAFAPNAPVNPYFSVALGISTATGGRRDSGIGAPVVVVPPRENHEWNDGGLLLGFGGGVRFPAAGGFKVVVDARAYVRGSPRFTSVQAGLGLRP